MKKVILVMDLGDNSKDPVDHEFVEFCDEFEQKFDKILLVRDPAVLLQTALMNAGFNNSFLGWILNSEKKEISVEKEDASVEMTFLFNCKNEADVLEGKAAKYLLEEMVGVTQFYSRGKETIKGFKRILTPNELQP